MAGFIITAAQYPVEHAGILTEAGPEELALEEYII